MVYLSTFGIYGKNVHVEYTIHGSQQGYPEASRERSGRNRAFPLFNAACFFCARNALEVPSITSSPLQDGEGKLI